MSISVVSKNFQGHTPESSLQSVPPVSRCSRINRDRRCLTSVNKPSREAVVISDLHLRGLPAASGCSAPPSPTSIPNTIRRRGTQTAAIRDTTICMRQHRRQTIISRQQSSFREKLIRRSTCSNRTVSSKPSSNERSTEQHIDKAMYVSRFKRFNDNHEDKQKEWYGK